LTCIIGIIEDNITYLGGDGLQLRGDRKNTKETKVHQRGEFLIGGAGLSGEIDLLLYSTDYIIPKEGQNTKEFFYNDFIPEYKRVLREHGRLTIIDNTEEMESQFLIGFRGELIVITQSFAVVIDNHQDNYTAIGSGEDYALGALFATNNSDATAKDKISIALAATSHHNVTVDSPFEIVWMDQSPDKIKEYYKEIEKLKEE
jgi:ATP-dependent protease HslVU (ClpYQ) peptidase subunit